MSNLDTVVKEVEGALTEARAEVARLETAYNALSGGSTPAPAPSAPAPAPSASASSGSGTRQSGSNGRRRGRPAGGGANRADQALQLIARQPGITIPQVAESMGIQPNYLYRVMPKLAQEGKVKRDGQGWFPV